jgi:hypothetical protein
MSLELLLLLIGGCWLIAEWFDPVSWGALIAGAMTPVGMSGTAAGAASALGTFASANAASLIGIGTVGMGGMAAYGSYQQASAQSDYMKKAYAAQGTAIGAQNRMIRAQETNESRKAINQSHLIESRIRVTAGESGMGMGGTALALMRQVDYDTLMNTNIIHQNAINSFGAAASGMQPIRANTYNPLIEGFMGGLGGLTTGLQIASFFKE